jgi:hypothetical protein
MDVIVRIHLSGGRMSGVGGVASPKDFAKALAYCLRFRSLLCERRCIPESFSLIYVET